MRRARWLRFTWVVLALCAGLWSAEVFARPGGGHTFGGRSRSSSRGSYSRPSSRGSSPSRQTYSDPHSDGVSGELIWLLLRLLFAYPWIGVPVIVLVIVFWSRARRSAPQSWELREAPPPVHAKADLSRLRELDPAFSRIVFEDFAYRLYASAQRARHDPKALAALAPYLSPAVRDALAAEPPVGVPVTNVVVGALAILDCVLRPASAEQAAKVQLVLDYVANISLGTGSRAQTWYVHEAWVLQRDQSARTKPPEETERLGCPNCGAPFESSDGRRCGYCGQVVADGRFAFSVVQRRQLEREAHPPALTSDVVERGTNFPSVIDPDNDAAFRRLRERDPAVEETLLRARVEQIYAALNRGWTALDLSGVRGFVSDALYAYLRYWTEAYTAQGLRNCLSRMRISRMQRVKVVLDPHYDAVTLRLWASGLDYTVATDTGARVSGSDSVPRAYSEYWTLIRAAGARGAPRVDSNCPSCAAPLQVNMAGNCQHCGSHITRGEFDWVLSKIEQDDVYAG